MTASYKHLPLAEVTPGMVLSDELLDKQGQVLLPAGAVLTEGMLALMPRHGVESLAVVSDEAADPVQTAAQQAALRGRIAFLFRKHDPDDSQDWAANALRQLVTDFRIDKDAP